MKTTNIETVKSPDYKVFIVTILLLVSALGYFLFNLLSVRTRVKKLEEGLTLPETGEVISYIQKNEDNSISSLMITEGSITTDKIARGTILFSDISQNGCSGGQLMRWSSSVSSWVCSDEIGVSLEDSTQIEWGALTNYPLACTTGSAVTQIGDTLVCTVFWNEISDIPTAAPSDGDTTHFSTADQIYDYVALSGYIRADGTIPLTANWNIGNGLAILADRIRARDADGLSLYDDGGNGIFIEDGGNVGIGTTAPDQALDITGALKLENTTSSTTGVIYKGNESFIHNFQHPTGDTAAPLGYNTFVGVGAGNFTTGSTATFSYEASYNLFVGYQAGHSNTTGYGNVFMGYLSGFSNTAAGNNVFIGRESGYFTTTGDSNVFVGRHAGYSNTLGDYNVFVGRQAGYSNTIGDYNVFIGREAGRYLSSGALNELPGQSLFLGYDTRAAGAGQTNQIVIGHGAVGLGSNTVVLGNSSIVTTALRGNVGIGTTEPGTTLPIGFQSGSSSSMVEIYATGAVYDTGLFLRGATGTGVGFDLWSENPAGNSYIDNRYNNDNGAIFFRMKTAGTPVNAMTIKATGNIGIGTTSPLSELQVKGYIQIDYSTDTPASADCDEASETGRMFYESDTDTLWVCQGTSGWQAH